MGGALVVKSDEPGEAVPRLTQSAQTEAAAREARRAAALRANLVRRKQQSRARTDEAAAAAGLNSPDPDDCK